MSKKLHIKKGDTVKILSGEDRGKTGKVLRIDAEDLRAIVEGINMVSKHTKPNAATPDGGIVKKEAPLHLSNLALVDGEGNAIRIGRKTDKNGKSVRYSKKSGEVIK